MLIDTHCHLNMMVKKKFDTILTNTELRKIAPIIKQAKEHDVGHMITVGTTIIENHNCIEIAQHYPTVSATVGIHPTDCRTEWQKNLKLIDELLKNKEKNKIIAVGECGLDFYWPGYSIQNQKDLFKAQIELSLEHNLALTIHTRNASEETLKILEEFKGQIKGVLHCFSENIEYAHQIIDIGLLLGIGAIITYPKNNQLREVIKEIPLEKIVLETDAPWLPPQSIRGKQNNPKYINEIAHYIADLKQVTFAEISEKTTDNALSIFNIEQ